LELKYVVTLQLLFGRHRFGRVSTDRGFSTITDGVVQDTGCCAHTVFGGLADCLKFRVAAATGKSSVWWKFGEAA
jgi:hypothetical protein